MCRCIWSIRCRACTHCTVLLLLFWQCAECYDGFYEDIRLIFGTVCRVLWVLLCRDSTYFLDSVLTYVKILLQRFRLFLRRFVACYGGFYAEIQLIFGTVCTCRLLWRFLCRYIQLIFGIVCTLYSVVTACFTMLSLEENYKKQKNKDKLW